MLREKRKKKKNIYKKKIVKTGVLKPVAHLPKATRNALGPVVSRFKCPLGE